VALKKRPDGRIHVQKRYEDAKGVKRSKSFYGWSRAEVEEKISTFSRALEDGQRIGAGDCTVREWAEEWLKTYKEPHIGIKSMESYTANIRLINDAIGSMKLKRVQQADLQRILNARAGLSGSSIRKTAMTIRALFKAAAVNRVIPFSPAEGLILPRFEDGSHRALTQLEIDALTGAAQALDIQTRKPHRFALSAMLMLFAGLRGGEAAAFRVGRDADLAAGSLKVNQSVSFAKNQAVLKEPKTAAGKRTIPIFPPLRPFLETAEPGYAARPSDGVQARNKKEKAAKPISRQAWRIAYKEFMDMAGVSCTPHDLRHTWFTMLYDAGVDVKTAQRWGGHASVTVTMEIYTHLSQERETASEKLIQEYFSKDEKGKNAGNKENENSNTR